jgi:hypothetical protein
MFIGFCISQNHTFLRLTPHISRLTQRISRDPHTLPLWHTPLSDILAECTGRICQDHATEGRLMYLAMCAVTRFTALRKRGKQVSTSDGPDREIGLCCVYIGDVCWILYFTEPHILATHTAHLPTDSPHISRPTHTPTSPIRHTCTLHGMDSPRSCDRGKINVFGNVRSNPILSFAKKGGTGKYLRRTGQRNRVVLGLHW